MKQLFSKILSFLTDLLGFLFSWPFFTLLCLILFVLNVTEAMPVYNLVLAGSVPSDATDLVRLVWVGFWLSGFWVGLIVSISDIILYFVNRKSSVKKSNKSKKEDSNENL